MLKKDIQAALLDILEAGSVATGGAWPNIEFAGVCPYFDVSFAAANRDALGISSGADWVETGRMSVVIAVDVGEGTVTAHDYADAVAGLFPYALKIALTGGKISIHRQPEIMPGFRDDAEWRVPVMIHYQAFTQ